MSLASESCSSTSSFWTSRTRTWQTRCSSWLKTAVSSTAQSTTPSSSTSSQSCPRAPKKRSSHCCTRSSIDRLSPKSQKKTWKRTSPALSSQCRPSNLKVCLSLRHWSSPLLALPKAKSTRRLTFWFRRSSERNLATRKSSALKNGSSGSSH